MGLDGLRSRGGSREGHPDRLGSTRKKTTETLGASCHHTGIKSRHDFWKSQSRASLMHATTQESWASGPLRSRGQWTSIHLYSVMEYKMQIKNKENPTEKECRQVLN